MVRFPAGERDNFLLRNDQISGAHPVSSPKGTKVCFTGNEAQGREADHLHPSSAEVSNCGGMRSLPHTSSLPSA